MTYSIEKTRNINLEDTAIPNLFITDFMPDVPDGDFVKVYIYAYMCCRQGIALTHTELAARVGLEPSVVISAWRYFAERRIVKLSPQASGDETYFDVEFIDVKGMLYTKEKPKDKTGAETGTAAKPVADSSLAALFQRIAVICGSPSIDGSDAQRIISWIEEDGASPEIIEFAYAFCRDERGEKGARYVGKVVREWTENGLKTVEAIRDYRARTDARSGVHKKLMEAVGLRYSVITKAEEKKFNLWLDEYGYTLDQLLEWSEKTAGVGNKLKYLEGIIRKEREAEGKSADTGGKGSRAPRSGLKDRNEYYREARRKNEDAAAVRLEEIYRTVPEVKRTDDEIALLNMELIKTLTSGMQDKQNAVKRLNSEIEAASARRKDFLKGAGYAPDHTDILYDCSRCRDTGILESGASCDCFKPVN